MNYAVTNEKPELSVSFNEWLNLFIVYLLYSIAIILGVIAFIIPSIYLSAKYGFAEFETVLNKKQPVQSLKSSWKSTKSNLAILIWGSVIIGGLSILVDIPLSFIGEISVELSILTDVISQLVSIVSMVFMSVFYFRVYELNKTLDPQPT